MRTPEAWLQEGLLAILADGAPKTVHEVADALEPQLPVGEVQTALGALVDQGLVRCLGPTAGPDPSVAVVYYEIVPTVAGDG